MARVRVQFSIATAEGHDARRVAEWLQGHSTIEGSVQDQVGFGTWGVEAGVIVTTLTDDITQAERAVLDLLVVHRQTCAYVELWVEQPDGSWSFAAEEWRKVVERSVATLRVADIAGRRGKPEDLEPEKQSVTGFGVLDRVFD